MFYLGLFFKSLTKKPISGITFILLYFFMFFLFANQGEFRFSALKKVFPSQKQLGAEFKISYLGLRVRDDIKAKLKSTPGVLKIQEVQSEDLDASLLSELKKSKLFINEIGNIKVILDPNVSRENAELLRQYFDLNYPLDEVMVSPKVKFLQNSETSKRESFLGLADNLMKIIVLFIYVCMIFSYYLMSLSLAKQSYIIEEFQRKNYVYLKSSLAGLFFLFFLTVVLNTFLFSFPLVSLLTIEAVLGVTLFLFSLNLHRNRAYAKIS